MLPAGFFVAALIVVAAILLVRRTRRRHVRKQLLALEGNNPDKPLAVSRFDEMDRHIAALRCACGGVLNTVSEGGVSTAEQSVRVIHTECGMCEEVRDFFFETSEILH